MNLSYLADTLSELLDEAVREKVFPGAIAGISLGPPEKRQTLILARGSLSFASSPDSQDSVPLAQISKNVFFDLASLTKPFATLLSILCLVKSQKAEFSAHLPDLLKLKLSSPLADITLAHLIGHSSGLPAYQPYHERLRSLPPDRRINIHRQWLLQEKQIYAPGSKTIYSDLGYMFLSWIVETQVSLPFDTYVKNQVMAPLDLENRLFFNKAGFVRKVQYAPTEKCPWRQKTLRGEVHDDNCYTLGGVSGHAGLFGNISGVLALSVHLLDAWKGRVSHPNYCPSDLKKMTQRQNIPDNTWALGFDTPSPSGSSAGRNMSEGSFGHLGFTGTSFWIDPHLDLVMVLLSNRVHPSRENEKIRRFRPRFHESITGCLSGLTKHEIRNG